MSLENIIKTVLHEFREIARTETVVGKPIAFEDTVIVPVSKISFGFGAGGGKGNKDDSSAGTGGGGSVEPVGFIVIHKGKAQIMSLKESEMSIGKLIGMAPDVFKKVKAFREKREKEKAGEEGDAAEDDEG